MRRCVLPISWVSINLYSGLDSRVPNEARRAPRRSSCTTAAQTLSLVGWQTLLDAGCCIKLFQLTLIAFSLVLFRVCPRVPVLDSTRRKKFNEIDTTFWKTKEKQQLRSIASEGWILNGAESGFCFHKRKCVGRLSLWHKLYKTYPLVN